LEKFKAFLKRKNIVISAKKYGIDTLGAMAQGLFATLLIGTIISTIGEQAGLEILVKIGGFAKAATGPGMAIAIGYSLEAPPLVLFSIASSLADFGDMRALGRIAFKVIGDNISAQIQLLQQDGKVKTLATPTLLVANNEVSRIFSGKEYPLVTGWSQGDTVVSESGIVQGTMTVQITKEDVGTMLLITPNINADKTVTLRLLQENSEISPGKVEIPVDGGHGESKAIEYVESRSLAGTFVAKDGMTIMAGGLVKETEGETYWRTPVLGSIPLLGWLFRGTEKVKQRTELIVLIKPHVILTPMEGGKISSDLMKALSAHPAADGRDSMGVHKPVKEHTVPDDVKNMTK